MDPERWVYVVRAVRDAMIKLDPAIEPSLRENAERHLADIAKLTAYAKQVLASVPADQRVLVTAHDAFNYFGRAFDFEVVGIQGISTESEAGLNRVAELVDLLGGDTDIGRAYEVDLRLRPDGEAGPLVVPVGVLEAYHRERAQLWEIQALGRLRFVAGPASLGRKVEMLADRLTDFSRGNPGVAAW